MQIVPQQGNIFLLTPVSYIAIFPKYKVRHRFSARSCLENFFEPSLGQFSLFIPLKSSENLSFSKYFQGLKRELYPGMD